MIRLLSNQLFVARTFVCEDTPAAKAFLAACGLSNLARVFTWPRSRTYQVLIVGRMT